MRRLTLLLAVIALVLLGAPQAGEAATCTAKQKRTAQAALAAYRKAMPKHRAAYFKTHKKPALRKRFVKKQQAKLKARKAAAACRVVVPRLPTPTPPPPLPPPPPPPPLLPAEPPRDTTPPQLTSAAASGSTVTVRFSEDVAVADAVFAVYVNGGARTPLAMTAQARTVVLSLGQAVGGADVVTLDYGGGVKDAAGNAAAPVQGVVVANATPTPCSFMVGNGGLGGPGAMNEGPTDLTLHPPAVGELRGIVIWVDFSDAPASESIAALKDQIFKPASDAYSSMSYGKLALTIHTTAQWYRLPQPSTYYGLNAGDGPGRKDEYIAAAVQAADGHVDFSNYDFVYLVPAAGASADMATGTQRPHGSGLVTVDGTEIRLAVLVGSDRLAGPTNGSAQVIHETGHVLGLPDLYADPTAVGGWDMMSLSPKPGAEFMAWHRWKLAWLDPPQLRCVQPMRTVEATLTPLETAGGVKMIVAPLDATHALVVENRQPLGLDARLCDKGVLVYTVNGAVTWTGNPIRVGLPSPGSDTDEAQRQRCGPNYNASLDLGPGKVSSYQDAASGVRVDLIAAADGNYVVRVSR